MFIITEQGYTEETGNEVSETPKKKKIFRFLKFYLILGWRDHEFSDQEYQIEKIKSKRRLFRRLLKPLTIAGFIMVLFVLILAVYAPWITEIPLHELVPPNIPVGGVPFDEPSADHPLGTTKNAYDILARIIWGARTTLLMALIPTTIAVGGGMILGTISAYFGGIVDYIIMRFVDLMYAFPTMILVIILIPILGQALLTSLIIIGILFIPYN
ncbi:MAG: ABC transporter permease, partial [Promethearchaeota archaeon]